LQSGIHTDKNSYFPALTGIRALAAYLVFLQHHRPSLPIPESLNDGLIQTGHTGVTMFFVLSGFLISFRYSDKFKNQGLPFGQYMGYRFARIYPLYLLLTIVILIWSRNGDIWQWFLNLTLLKGFFDKEKFTGLAQGWSLTVEECFYLAAPILFGLFQKYGLLVVAGLIAVGFGIVFLSQLAGSGSFMATPKFMLNITFFGRCFEFYCGYWLAQKLKEHSILKERTGSIFTYSGIVLTAGGLFLVNWVTNNEFALTSIIPMEIVVNNLALPLAITVLYYGLVAEKSLISSLFSSVPVQILGKSSYAFYLIHAGLFAEFIYFHLSKNKLIIFLFLNIFAILIYYCLERPANNFIRKWLHQKQTGKISLSGKD
jgi:peptidoglycan/LPS O-acetylase OafA/YrhL